MKQRKSSQIAKSTAIISFIIGTVIFVLFKLTEFEFIFATGLFYVFGAVITNLVLLFFLIINLFFVELKERVEILKYIFLMLLNIPIAIIYLSYITI